MPKIAELRVIDGAMWARLDIDVASDDQPVHLLTASELAAERAVHWLPGHMSEAEVLAHPLYSLGNTVRIWVNEADLIAKLGPPWPTDTPPAPPHCDPRSPER